MEGINLIDIPIHILNFIITFAVLYLLLYKPISIFLEARRERIANTLKEAEEARKEAEQNLQESRKELAGTAEKARKLTHEAIENAALSAEQVLDKAEEEAAAIIKRTQEQMEAKRQASLERAYTELVSLAGELSTRIISREVTIEDNRKIADRFFSEVTKRYKEAVAENNAEEKTQ